MRIIRLDIHTTRYYDTPMCACIGYFDGMHLGHKALVDKTIQLAEKYQCESALITFEPDPWVAIKGIHKVQHITTMKERINRAVSLGIQNIIILEFTAEMSHLSPDDFINHILNHLNLKALVCGFDFHYGYMGAGDAMSLKERGGIDVHVVDAINDDEGKISSTRITKAIESGDMISAYHMLGYFFSIEGKVIHGRRQGTGIGFPTANLEYSDEYIQPKGGVYAGFALIDTKHYRCMINYGHNPTFNYRKKMSLEANIFNYSGDLYGKTIRLEFVKYIRAEVKFKNRDNLIMQLEQDTQKCNQILPEYER